MSDPLERYPKSVDGLLLRPMHPDDEDALVEFFRRIPVDERKLFRDDVTKVPVVRAWIRNLNYDNILPLLAFRDSRIVADATLHRDRRGWSRHVAKIRLTLDPDQRRKGLGRLLVRELVSLAPALKVALLHAEVLDVQAGARALFESLDFTRVATLPQHAIDFAGRVHDVLVYSLVLSPPERMAAEAALLEEEADIGGG